MRDVGPKMARGGLEPPTPRFSVVRSYLSNDAENAANSRLCRGRAHIDKLRKFHEFHADSGDDGRPISQSGPPAVEDQLAVAAAGREPERAWRAGVVGDEVLGAFGHPREATHARLVGRGERRGDGQPRGVRQCLTLTFIAA
jgi:hypothetical protein